MVANHPVNFSADLTEERLKLLCLNCLDVVADSILDSSSIYDTQWTKGCLPYGRLQGLMYHLSLNKELPWIKLANKTMDYTISIGSTFLQFVIDDPYNPKKIHRLNSNSIENIQSSFDFEQDSNVMLWRLFIGIDKLDSQAEPTATLVGYDSNRNPVCFWSYDDAIQTPMMAEDTKVVEIPEPILARKQNRDDSVNGTK
ncbi:hypothetical protein [Shewanella baltica]|uniref:hypothetical protein n=1 Tax=Shewanella baltica TaxID=62322 RepID=UPI003D7B472C